MTLSTLGRNITKLRYQKPGQITYDTCEPVSLVIRQCEIRILMNIHVYILERIRIFICRSVAIINRVAPTNYPHLYHHI